MSNRQIRLTVLFQEKDAAPRVIATTYEGPGAGRRLAWAAAQPSFRGFFLNGATWGAAR